MQPIKEGDIITEVTRLVVIPDLSEIQVMTQWMKLIYPR